MSTEKEEHSFRGFQRGTLRVFGAKAERRDGRNIAV
jgi:hypothetical protein